MKRLSIVSLAVLSMCSAGCECARWCTRGAPCATGCAPAYPAAAACDPCATGSPYLGAPAADPYMNAAPVYQAQPGLQPQPQTYIPAQPAGQ